MSFKSYDDNYIKFNKKDDKLTIHNDNRTYTFYLKNILGFIIIYGIVLIAIPYYLIKKSYDTIFITYFANVDIISNILAINFPSYFKNVYNFDPSGLGQNISYNIISLVALSGIFIHGLSEKNKKVNDINIFVSMVIMAIITWTLPTKLVPYLVSKFNNIFNIKNDPDIDIIITTLISSGFLILEGILIYLYLNYKTLLPHHDYLQNLRFKF